MWRLHGFVGRVLGRYHGNTPLRLSQGHHVEDEVLSTSTALSTGLHPSDSGSQKEENGRKKQKKKTFKFCSSGLPRYTALDAMGWGTAAVLLMQICRKIHSQFAVNEASPGSGVGTYREAGSLKKCGYRVLLEILSRRDVLPRGVSVNCLRSSLEDKGSGTGASHTPPMPENSTFYDSVGASQSSDSQSDESLSSVESAHQETATENHLHEGQKEYPALDEELAGAADNLRHVAESSVPVILNIIGIESAIKGDSQAAFLCFLAATKHGYSKAQFNTGVCYEKGQGVSRNLEMAVEFYRQAAAGGHSQAQYRYAMHLLHSRGQQQHTENTLVAIDLLEKAAVSGVRKAQAYLGVLFTQEPTQDWQKAVHYLRMAAEHGDAVSQLYLGHCYREGLGVGRSLSTTLQMYRRAAEGGNPEARRILSAWRAGFVGVPENVFLRSTRSAPCFASADQLHFLLSAGFFSAAQDNPESGCSSRTLPHSCSMGSIHTWPLLSPLPELPQESGSSLVSTNTAPCGWTIGVG
nr:death ligand signal enhancer [Paramormyrops kingsleyae]